MICDQEKKTVRVVGRNREVAAAGERLILDILADARAKRASAKDAADVGEDGDARVDDRGGDNDYGEGGAENRAGESRKDQTRERRRGGRRKYNREGNGGGGGGGGGRRR